MISPIITSCRNKQSIKILDCFIKSLIKYLTATVCTTTPTCIDYFSFIIFSKVYRINIIRSSQATFKRHYFNIRCNANNSTVIFHRPNCSRNMCAVSVIIQRKLIIIFIIISVLTITANWTSIFI